MKKCSKYLIKNTVYIESEKQNIDNFVFDIESAKNDGWVYIGNFEMRRGDDILEYQRHKFREISMDFYTIHENYFDKSIKED